MKFPPKPVIQFMQRNWKTILLVILVSLATLLLNITISIWLRSFHNLHLPSLGTIRVIGVEASILFIDWGTVYPGTPTNRSFYIKSISNEPITLQLTTQNLTFQNSEGTNITQTLPVEEPLHLTWNYSGSPLNPKERIYIVLTLIVSSDSKFLEYIINNDVKQFYFDIIIKPME